MLAIVQAAARRGPVRIGVTSPGLRGAEITLRVSEHRRQHRGGRAHQIQLPRSPAAPAPTSLAPSADASFTGSDRVLPGCQ
jgi:hypothetical protein